MGHKSLKNLASKLLSSQPMNKMTTQSFFFASILFSFVFSYSSLYLSPLMFMYSENLMNYIFASRSFQFLTNHAMNKNCVFLICNGLLVFVVKTSGRFVRSPSAFDLNDMLQNKIGDGLQVEIETETEPQVALQIEMEPHLEKDVISIDESGESKELEEKPKEVPISIEEISDKDKEADDGELEDAKSAESEVDKCCVFDDDHGQLHGQEEEEKREDDQELHGGGGGGGGEDVHEQEEEEHCNETFDEMEKLSTEELNQKFEDFIRRMKEEIRINNIEARHQLVMVN